MPRKVKQIIDYFPHNTKHGKTLYIIENKYGNNGYAFWFKLLEILGSSEGHYINLNNEYNKEYMSAFTRLMYTEILDILETLANLDAIDKKLLEKGIVWSQNFVDNLDELYKRRICEKPKKPIYDDINGINVDINDINVNINPQSKVKESKVKESKVNIYSDDCKKVIDYFNNNFGTKYKYSKASCEHIQARINDGYSYDDCITVIEKKKKDIYFINNPQYFNPVTLFRPSNFEKYLNELDTPNKEIKKNKVNYLTQRDKFLNEEKRDTNLLIEK